MPKRLMLMLCLAAPTVLAATAVRLDSYSIDKSPLPAPLSVPDAAGVARTADHVYVVRIKGVIPTTQAHPVRLFIGDTPIREYGATRDGIYFKVYDLGLLRQLHGKPFRYLVPGQSATQTALIFHAPAE